MATARVLLNMIGDEAKLDEEELKVDSAESLEDITKEDWRLLKRLRAAILKTSFLRKNKLVRPDPNAACTNSTKIHNKSHHAKLVTQQKYKFSETVTETYTLSSFWRYTLRAMDAALIIPFLLSILIGRLGMQLMLEAGIDDQAIWTWLAFYLCLKAVSDVMFAPLKAYFDIRDLIVIYVSEQTPSEARLLLLEWKRNRNFGSEEDHFSFLEYIMLIKVIEKARQATDQNVIPNTARSCIDSRSDKAERIREELRELLLFGSQLPRYYVPLYDDVEASESRAPVWEYDHNTWELKDLWPKRISGTVSVFFYCDLLLHAYLSVITFIGSIAHALSIVWVFVAVGDQYPAIWSDESKFFSSYGSAVFARWFIYGWSTSLWDLGRFAVLRWIQKDPTGKSCDNQTTITIDMESSSEL